MRPEEISVPDGSVPGVGSGMPEREDPKQNGREEKSSEGSDTEPETEPPSNPDTGQSPDADENLLNEDRLSEERRPPDADEDRQSKERYMLDAYYAAKEKERLRKAQKSRRRDRFLSLAALSYLLPLLPMSGRGVSHTVAFFALLVLGVCVTSYTGKQREGKLLRGFSSLGTVYFPFLLSVFLRPMIGYYAYFCSAAAFVVCLLIAVRQGGK